MTPFYYLDTWALVKHYKPENGSDNIEHLFSYSFQKRILTSTFTIIEIASTGNRLVKSNAITLNAWNKMTIAFSYDSDEFIHFVSLDDRIILLSVALIKKHGLRPGDAIQLASLIQCRDSVRGYEIEVQFVASDNLLCLAAEKEGFKVHNPASITEEWDIH